MTVRPKQVAFALASISSTVANAQGNFSAPWAYAQPSSVSSPVPVVLQSSALTGISETTQLYYSVLNTALSLVPVVPQITSLAESFTLSDPSSSLSSSILEVTSASITPTTDSIAGGVHTSQPTSLPTTTPVETVMASILPAVSILGSALRTYTDPISSFAPASSTAAGHTILTSAESTSSTDTISSSPPPSSYYATSSSIVSSSVPAVESSSVGAATFPSTTPSDTAFTTTGFLPITSQSPTGSLTYVSPSVISSVMSSFITRSSFVGQTSSVSTSVQEPSSTSVATPPAGESRSSTTQTSPQALPSGVKPAATTAAPPANGGTRAYPITWISAMLVFMLGVSSH